MIIIKKMTRNNRDEEKEELLFTADKNKNSHFGNQCRGSSKNYI